MKKQTKKEDEIIVLFRHQAVIDDLKNKLEALKPIAQQLVDCFKKLAFYDEGVSFYNIYANIDSMVSVYLNKKLPDTILKTDELELDKQKAISLGLMKVPGLAQFTSKLDEFKAQESGQLQQYFTVKDGTIEIEKTVWDNFLRKNSITVDPEEKKSYFIIQNYIAVTQNLHEHLKEHYKIPLYVGPLLIHLSEFCMLDNDKKLILNPKAWQMLKVKKKRSGSTE